MTATPGGEPQRPARRTVVVHPRTAAARGSHRRGARPDVREQTELGLTMITSLRRSQLRLATFALLAITVLVGGIPLLFLAVPGLREARVGGIAAGWLILGVAVFPAICGIGWAYTRAAERNEHDFVELVERS
jgi:hypothetical protein